MIEILPESKGPFIGLNIKGKLTHHAYKMIVPLLEKTIKNHKKISLLIDLEGFKGWKMRAALDDVLFDIKNHHAIERVAIICEKQSDEWLSLIDQPFMRGSRGKSKYFLPNDKHKAWNWLEALPRETHNKNYLHEALIYRKQIGILGNSLEALFFACLLKQWSIPYKIFLEKNPDPIIIHYTSEILPYLQALGFTKTLLKHYPECLETDTHVLIESQRIRKIFNKKLFKKTEDFSYLESISLKNNQLILNTDKDINKSCDILCIFNELKYKNNKNNHKIVQILHLNIQNEYSTFTYIWNQFHQHLLHSTP